MTVARTGHWIEEWDPEDPTFWEYGGARIARKNLWLSMFAEHIGFAIWVVWTIVVLNLADAGFKLSVSELFLLTLLPNLVGSLLRLPYTFAIPRFGGRLWTTVSAALLLLPALLLAVVVPSHWLVTQPHGTQMWVLALCSVTSGVGGGNFASSMANISFFYPQRKKGLALGLNAAGGQAYPLYLTTGRYREHYNSGTQTRRLSRLVEASPVPRLQLHPALAESQGVADGDPVRVESRRGSASFAAEVTPSIRRDTVFVPFHWSGHQSANLLTISALDPVSRMPEFKVCAVRIRPDRPGG